jgi:Tol biopolymer transport system component
VQEAKAASALSHPGIITVHDVASENGVDFIVMEWVHGETLDSRVPRRGLRTPEVLKIAVQIADALAAAHAAGIVHRDLKPANVMVTDSGLVKVLDFGLAKVRPAGRASEDDATASLRTADGTMMGTCAYMSPEQAEGRPVDARSDIFSFGALLYEMATGRSAFKAESPVATLASVLRDEPPPPRTLVPELPVELERIVLRCLRKDPAKRFQTMADLKVALEELKEESESGRHAPSPPGVRRGPVRVAIGAVAAAAVLAAAFLFARRRFTPPFRVALPVPLTSFGGHVSSPSLSPDGTQVAFVWDGETQGQPDVYVKLVGPGSPVRVTSTPAVEYTPSWSPDGRSLAFVRRVSMDVLELVVVPALGGSERVIARQDFGPGVTWTPDGRSLLVAKRDARDAPHGLFAVSVATGELKRLTAAPREAWTGDNWPAFAPDGTLAFARGLTRSNSEIYLLDVDREMNPRGEPRRLTYENGSSVQPTWSPDGRRVLFAAGGFGASSSPVLMHIARNASPGTRAERVDGTEGGESPTFAGSRLVYVRTVRDENVWRLPLEDGRPGEPRALIASTRRDGEPRFSPDGKELVFLSDRSGGTQVWRSAADGSGAVQLTSLDATIASGARWSPDGKSIVFVANPAGQVDVYLTTPNGTTPRVLVAHPAHDSAPSFSRDGRFVYFASNRDGAFQVWKTPSDGGGTPARVTNGGGFAALESPDGTTLYYAKRADSGTWSLWTMPAAGGEERALVPALATWGDFDVTKSGVYYVDSPNAGARLTFRRSSDGSATVLATLAKRPSFGVAACPDDTCVLFTQLDVDASELMLAEVGK